MADRPSPLPANFLLVGIILLGLIFAAFLGLTIGNHEIKTLTLIFGASITLLYILFLYRYVWHLALILIFVGFGYRPASFAFGPVEVTCALGFAVIALFFWQKRVIKRPAILEDPSFNFMLRLLFVWLAYVALHLVYNIKAPYRPQDFALSNAIKSYFALSAPLLLFYLISKSPAGLKVGGKFLWRIMQFAFAGLILNLAFHLYQLKFPSAQLVIPKLNAGVNTFLLRTHGPLAMLIGAVVITGARERLTPGLQRLIAYFLLVGGIFGSLTSGGRGSIVFGWGMVCCVLAFRRRIVALSILILFSIAGIVIANLFANWINTRANPYLQRSVQWAVVGKNSPALESIESSTNWRRELANRALTEWRSDPRIFWFGRATYGFGAADETAWLIAGGYEALIQTSLRRGATHNLFTDLLIAYGLAGCVLYVAVYAAIIRWLWKLRKVRDLSPSASNLILICLIGWLGNFILEAFGAGTMKIEMIWFTIILLGAFYGGIAASGTLTATREPSPLRPLAENVSARRRQRPVLRGRQQIFDRRQS